MGMLSLLLLDHDEIWIPIVVTLSILFSVAATVVICVVIFLIWRYENNYSCWLEKSVLKVMACLIVCLATLESGLGLYSCILKIR